MKWDPERRRLPGPSCVHFLFIPISSPAASIPDGFYKINPQQVATGKATKGGLIKSKYHLRFWWFLQNAAGSSQSFVHPLGCWMYLCSQAFMYLLLFFFLILLRFFCNSGKKAQALLCNRSHQTAQKCSYLVVPTRGSIPRLSVSLQHCFSPGTWHLCSLSSIWLGLGALWV